VDRAIAAAEGQTSAALGWAHYVQAISIGIMSQWTRDPALADAAREEVRTALSVAAAYPNTLRVAKGGAATLELMFGDYETAARMFADLPAPIAQVEHATRAAAAHLVGDHAVALSWAKRMVDYIHTEQGQTVWYSGFVSGPAAAIAGSGDIEGGKAILREVFDVIRRSGGPGGLEDMVVSTAAIAHMAAGDDPNASRLLAWVRSRTFEAGRILPTPSGYALYQHYVAVVRDALPREEAHRYIAEGRSWSEDEAVERALELLHS
jgi:hypothetical protein